MSYTDRRARLRGGFKLNQTIMRSHMRLKAASTRQYDLGPLPYTWEGDYGLAEATTGLHYLHSSIKGFIDEAAQIERDYKLDAFFTARVNDICLQNQQRIRQLREGCENIKVEMFGGTRDQDVNTTPAIQEFYGKNAAFFKTLEELRSFATYRFHDVNWKKDAAFLDTLRRRLKQDPNNPTLKQQHDDFARQFYDRYAKTVSTQIQQLYDFINQYGSPASFTKLLDVLQDMETRLRQQIDTGAKSISFSRKLNIPSRLGKAFEPIVTFLLNNTKQGAAHFVADETIADQNFITDAIIKGKNTKTVVIHDSTSRFLNGLSIKFTNNNSFDAKPTIHTNETLSEFTENMADQQVDALAYLYNNIVALSLYNSSDRTRGAVRGNLMSGHNRVGKVFSKMLKYYNLYLINTFLWGNAKDAGSVQPFNKDYFNNIGKTPAPVFFVNQNQFFESWRVFQNIQDTILGGTLLWDNNLTNSLFSDSRTGQAALRELYATKAAWLTQSSDAIYTVLRHRPKVNPMPAYLSFNGKSGVTGGDSADNIMETFLQPTWNPYRDIIQQSQSRTLRTKIELLKYY